MDRILGMPLLASAHGHKIDQLIFWLHVLMVALLVGWGTFFIVALIRFRKSKNPKADYVGVKSHASTYLEATVAIIEAVFLVGLSIPFWMTHVNAMPPEEENPLRVRVVAQQFAWNIHYPGPDGVFGKAGPKFVDEQSNPLGLDPDDPNGKDDITTVNQLHLPVNRPVIVQLSSKDVVHCFKLPEFRVTQDVIPGMSIPTTFTPTMTTAELRKATGKEDRNFEITCAQLCGLGHYRMRGFITVHTQEEFDKWLADESAKKTQAGDSFWG